MRNLRYFTKLFFYEKKENTLHQTLNILLPRIRKTNPCFMYEGKRREELNLVIFKDIPAMNSHINGKLSTRPIHWYGCWSCILKKIYALPLFCLHTNDSYFYCVLAFFYELTLISFYSYWRETTKNGVIRYLHNAKNFCFILCSLCSTFQCYVGWQSSKSYGTHPS